ncbi:MAG: universal stress protein [Geminicoccaceae bacterium]|nr:universal stress protein [Geminicoccaceae bacterium]
MRTILAHLEISPGLDAILETSLLVARKFDSYIEGFHMRPGQPDVIAAGADGFVAAAPDLVAGFEREAKERAQMAGERFEAFMAKHGLRRASETESGLCADWRIELGGGQAAIGSRGRIFDIVVVGRPLKDHVTPSVAALEAALFDAGRPVMVAPPQPVDSMGRHVVIAWNGSTETARTIGFARPYLHSAEEITVVTVDKGLVPGPTGAELTQNLRRQGLGKVSFVEVPPGNRNVGEAILDETKKVGGDFLIKGAYTQSRFRQMIFGGATSHILAEADLPVFMAN